MLALGFALLLLVTGEFAGVSGNKDGPDCDVKNAGICYKISVNQSLGTDYKHAASFCKASGYEIARIPNLTVQTEIMTFLRQKMTEINRHWVRAWIGATINSAGVVTPQITDGQWYPMFPMMRHRNFQWTNIYLHVNPDCETKYQGLINTYPHYKTNGVVCQYVPHIAVECTDGFVYKEKCYFTNFNATALIKIQDRERYCNVKGGTLGSILDQEHQILAEKYVRPSIPVQWGSTVISLATNYNASTKTFITPEGHSYPATSLRWVPRFPSSGPRHTTMRLYVGKDPSDDRSGVYNLFTSHSNAFGVFCERRSI